MFAGIPWFSTFTLATETLVTAGVLYVFYQAYYFNAFSRAVAGVVLGYETLFNITYMASRVSSHVEKIPGTESPLHIALAIFHGIFSLLMFILLLVFMYLAWRAYDNGINYFHVHKRITLAFLIAWMIAIISGFAFYYETYFSDEGLNTANIAVNH